MNLIIDVGNTRIKIAVFKKGKLIHSESITKENIVIKVVELINKFECRNAIISSVGNIKKTQISKLHAIINLIELTSETKIPFINKYSTPKTLGMDRVALVSAAVKLYSNKNVLVIDAGTCITYDYINMNSCYFGGAISPGIQMRYKSLNKFTKNLPLLEPKYTNQLIGQSTDSCIHLGVVKGTINEIDSFINQYRKKNKDLTVVLTGGDTKLLANRLKNSIFANPIFLLEGLNAILTYNL
ncbi:type III pantothenate kinase [Lutibacter profundi]|uniref:Type III pantothenate kinase n=1 Tax=Lutibacter profundi TaxID=1622118 RepID=A0A109RNH9_9FLAO|nr:type III pantothenate kinase [Lutibacter profundi]AMC10750.1 type III pantothenate kinase [Lutibacter profundi]